MVVAQRGDHGACSLPQRPQEAVGKRREPRLDYDESCWPASGLCKELRVEPYRQSQLLVAA
jgi:hypothetical protein